MLFWCCVRAAHLAVFCLSACTFKCCKYICFSTFGPYTPYYVFITLLFHASGLGRYFQACPSKYQYTNEVFHKSNSRQQCPELKIETMDVEMCEEPRTDEDAPVGSSLRWSSGKAARDATQSIKSQAKEGVQKKGSRSNGTHKSLAVRFPQAVKPATSDPLYVPVSDSKSTKIDDDVMCLDSGEEGSPNIRNEVACVQEMERVQRMCADIRKMRENFERSLAIGMHWIMQCWRLKTRILEMMHSFKKHTATNICDNLLNARTDFGV